MNKTRTTKRTARKIAAAKPAIKIKTKTPTTRTANTTMTKRKKTSKSLAPTKAAKELTEMGSKTDLNGSYTGKPLDPNEIPVQDADDL